MSKVRFPKFIMGLRPTLICSIGALTVLTVGMVALTSYFSGRAIVSSLGSGMVNLGLARLEQAVRSEFNVLRYQTEYVRDAVVNGGYGPDAPDKLADLLKGSLAAAPQINGIIVVDGQSRAVSAIRENRGSQPDTRALQVPPDSSLAELARRAENAEKPFWREPRYIDGRKSTVFALCVPVRKDDEYLGFIAAGIFSRSLSEFVRDISQPGRFEAFILFGRGHVLAHPALADGSVGISEQKPLLSLKEVRDPVLENLDKAYPQSGAELRLPEGSEALAVDIAGVSHQLFLRRVEGYGGVPLYVGAHLTETRIERVMGTLHKQAITGLGLLLAATVLAVILSRMIARPIRRAARGVSSIRSLDFDKIEPLERSRLKEIDDLAVSFNAMLGGLSSFGRYVPRTLVTRLIRENRVGAGSEERELTVMFTDIAGFSKICESMTAKQVAEFVNAHLALVSQCIENEGGTIDKYIGDAVMAFWGAPDNLENTAEPACRAALAIRDAIRKDNQRRVAAGEEPVRIRIGIHTGPLVVGDIGPPSRMNYTVVGDIVNGAQRLEALGKELAPDADVSILISSDTEAQLNPSLSRRAEGARQVKGKQKQLDVFRLD